MAFCIILDVDFAVVSDVLPPFVLRLTSYIDVRCVKPALVLFPFQRMVQRTHNCTRVLFLFRRCSSFPPPISYCFSIFSGSAAHAFVCFSVFRSVAMAQHRAQTAVCCVRAHTSMDLHFLLSWIFAFRRIQKERESEKIYILFVYVFAWAPLSHFGCLLKTQFCVCVLRFISNYIFFSCSILGCRLSLVMLLVHLGAGSLVIVATQRTNESTLTWATGRALARNSNDNKI